MNLLKLFVVNNGKIEEYNLPITAKMPYSKYLSVREFRGSSKSLILWTDIRLMQAFDPVRVSYDAPIISKFGFKLMREGGHANFSQHYAGLALDFAQASNGYSNGQRAKLRDIMKDQGKFKYIEPSTLAPTWVHGDVRHASLIHKGDVSVYTFVLQDALDFLGYPLKIDGDFGPATLKALIEFKKKNKLKPDGTCDGATWIKLGSMVARKRG